MAGEISGMSPDYEEAIFGDLISTSPRQQASSAAALSSTTRTLHLLLGRIGRGRAVTGFRLLKTTAMSGGAATASLYTSSDPASTSWSRVAAGNVTPTLTGTGFVSTACGFTASDDLWVRLLLVLTTAPTIYPAFAYSNFGTAPTAITTKDGHPVTSTINASTAPGATLDPSAGSASASVMWASLY